MFSFQKSKLTSTKLEMAKKAADAAAEVLKKAQKAVDDAQTAEKKAFEEKTKAENILQNV